MWTHTCFSLSLLFQRFLVKLLSKGWNWSLLNICILLYHMFMSLDLWCSSNVESLIESSISHIINILLCHWYLLLRTISISFKSSHRYRVLRNYISSWLDLRIHLYKLLLLLHWNHHRLSLRYVIVRVIEYWHILRIKKWVLI